MIFRLFVEDKNREAVIQAISKYFDGFTVIPAIGYYKGQRENSLVVDVVAEDSENTLAKIPEMLEDVRRVAEQESVLFQDLSNVVGGKPHAFLVFEGGTMADLQRPGAVERAVKEMESQRTLN